MVPLPLKLESDPLPKEISLEVKLLVALLLVKVSESAPSLEVNPSEPWAAVIIIVSPVVS